MRELALQNPLLDFERIVFAKRKPTQYSHMSDQYYGWWSRPGGGLFTLGGYRGGEPQLTCLTDGWPEGTFLRPDLSYDGAKLLFAFCKYYPETSGNPNKVDKASIPEDAFYHLFEMNVDGSGVHQLTGGSYDDFDARYLPNGDIVFLSTRRGQFVQCTAATSLSTLGAAMPDSYVRCGGGPSRPVAVYTLHTMGPDGSRLRTISPFENFEWTPSVTNDGRIIYARWDYVDRSNMPYMSLWSTRPDGTHPETVYGNFTHAPHCIFEARAIPDSKKLIFTASAHHSITGGSLVLLDTSVGVDGTEPLTRLTPEVCFPEIEGWPQSYYANPFPLSEKYYVTAWSDQPLRNEGSQNAERALGLYYYDAFGTLELLYRDDEFAAMYPLPLKPRPTPPILASDVDESQEGKLVLLDVYNGLAGVERGAVKALRVVGVPAKTQPTMNSPRVGITRDDPGKFVLGTVPVEADGSAHFHAPAGIGIFFQALDENGMALQTMRTLTYLQPNQTLSCVGCHEPRNSTPTNAHAVALSREPSRIKLGPEGSWPLRFDTLVQPVLEKSCVSCHAPGAADAKAAAFDLTTEKAYDTLINYGSPSLFQHISGRYGAGRSVVGGCAASSSALLKLLQEGHYDVTLEADDTERLVTWMDTYAQRLGSFSDDQERRLNEFKARVARLLEE